MQAAVLVQPGFQTRSPGAGGRPLLRGEMEDGGAAAAPGAVGNGHALGLFRGILGRAGRACEARVGHE